MDSRTNQAPAVSVVMPAHNAAPYIAASIESILAQTFQDFELIILNDASTDVTGDIINSYAARDSRVVAVQNAEKLNIAGNRNKGLELARGELVAWQDADDIALPDRLQKQAEFLRSHPRIGLVGGYLEFFSGEKALGVRKYAAADKELREKIFFFSPVAQPAAMVRKECFDKVGGFNPEYSGAEDIDMSFRIGTVYEFANLQQVVLRYRVHESSATFTKLRRIEQVTLEVRKKFSSHPAYHQTALAKAYNFFQALSLYLVPSKLKIWLFNFFRNERY